MPHTCPTCCKPFTPTEQLILQTRDTLMATLNDIKDSLLAEGNDLATLGTSLTTIFNTLNAILDATPGSAEFEAAMVVARANRVAITGEIAAIAAEAARVAPPVVPVVPVDPAPVVDPTVPVDPATPTS